VVDHHVTTKIRFGGSREIDGKLERMDRPGELRHPVSLGRGHGRKCLTRRDGVAVIGKAVSRFEDGLFSLDPGSVSVRELGEEHVVGPAVTDEVVSIEDEEMLLVTQPEECGTEEWPLFETKCRVPFAVECLRDGAFTFGGRQRG